MDVIIDLLGINFGAASQGLKVLRSVRAVQTVYMPSEHRHQFADDLELSKFDTDFIKKELNPRLDRALQRIKTMGSLDGNLALEDRPTALEPLQRVEMMLPWILRLLVK